MAAPSQQDRERFRQYREFISRVHLYHQQHTIDETRIDFQEFQTRLTNINFESNILTYQTELAQDNRARTLVESVRQLLNS